MKIRDIERHMNDHGTNPRIRVLKHNDDFSELIYEGSPYNIAETIAGLIVESFTVRGVGFLEVHV
ncbi:MAG: hypothetical protein IJP98_02405 [Clostridia bacterium]|nr:hypothetical protein [Clostridia bacterium]